MRRSAWAGVRWCAMGKIKTIEQERAAHALQHIERIKDNKDFVPLANGFATMIHTNGLGQAIAFIKGKKDSQYQEMANILSDWLCGKGRPFENFPPEKILDAITESDMQTYLQAQAEAMAYLLWVKKFAKALIGEDDDTSV